MRYLYLSYIKIFAVFFVVLSHAFGPNGSWNWVVNEENSFFSISNKIIEPFVSMMPILTFVSGFLYYKIRKNYASFDYLIKKKFERLIVPMIFLNNILLAVLKKQNFWIQYNKHYSKWL